MVIRNATLSLEHPFQLVKPSLNTQLPLFSDSVIHHKVGGHRNPYIVYKNGTGIDKRYGVSSAYLVLSPQLLLKKYDCVRDCLEHRLMLPTAQREAVLRLLRLWAYYGNVYPKEAQLTNEPGCRKATFWRTVRALRERGLLTVVNRYLIRPHAQISNFYLLHNLLLVIARWLAEHGTGFLEKWLQPYLIMPGSQFWGSFTRSLVPGPGSPASNVT